MEAETLPTVDTARKLGLLEEEYERIKTILSRSPNFTELSIFAVMWSEHCCYKNSVFWLKQLPKDSERMLSKAGEENAGIVDIGEGLACSFKIESHNHPSAVEPYQGAATGVGGINRDIFTMGARPVAQLNSLRFGTLSLRKTRRLLKGVVKGIGDYGNCFGVPVVGGEIYFDKCYNHNPLINAFSAGIVKSDQIAKATAYGAGNPVFIVGSATGKDGIHGAAFASKDITEASMDDLPSVQVGDPFMEKLLLEATLEVIASGCVIGIQDMGAAGIICSTSEMSAKGEHGMDIWLDKIPTRQDNMKPFEILLSESQERMLVVVQKGKEDEIKKIFDKWDLNCSEIGVVTETQHVRFYNHQTLEADVPCHDLVLGGGAPVYEREYEEPPYFKEYQQFSIDQTQDPGDYKAICQYLLCHPNIASRKWVSRQYDSMVGTRTMNSHIPFEAGLVNIKGTDKALAMTVDCNGRYVHADPQTGCAIAVAEAARNITCTGATPVAITDNLNFGNPYNTHVYWQFVGAIKGMKKACEAFNTPVTGGNVSFYNQSNLENNEEVPVFPTPVIGMLGILEDKNKRLSMHFKHPGDKIYLLGLPQNDISSSEYLYDYLQIKASPAPWFDLDYEVELQQFLQEVIHKKWIKSAHDVSSGGLLVSMIEAALPGELGFTLQTDETIRKDAFLFGESQSRVIVSIHEDEEVLFLDYAAKQNADVQLLGTVQNDQQVIVDQEPYFSIQEAKALYMNSLEEALDS